jgi:DNA-binding response OmpR family regulator
MAEAKTAKILVVDDEPDVQSLLNLMLVSQGYTVVTASDGQEALEKARSENPDLILLDVMLPRLDGYKVARMLKFDENFSHIPIIMLTAKVQEKDKQTGLETGADDYITKPFDTAALLLKVKEILEKKK